LFTNENVGFSLVTGFSLKTFSSLTGSVLLKSLETGFSLKTGFGSSLIGSVLRKSLETGFSVKIGFDSSLTGSALLNPEFLKLFYSASFYKIYCFYSSWILAALS